MTDDNNDPWRSLADELGVQPGQEGSTPPPPSTPNPPAARQRTQAPHSAPPKKKKSDWNALAGELGLEVSADSESPGAEHDPVAELLGFPPPGSLPPQRDEPESRRQHDEFDEESGEEFERSANRDRWRDEDDQQRRSNMYDDTRPVYDDTEPTESSEREGGNSREQGSADQQREYRPRRRGGRGRGRGRGGDRSREGRGSSSRYGNENRERRSYDDQRSGGQDEPQGERRYEDEPREGQSTESSEGRPEGSERTQERSRDEQSQRRRRGRRGRRGGRDRSDRPERRPYEQHEESNRSGGDEPIENLSDDLFDSADASVDFSSVDFSASAEVFGGGIDPHDDPLGGDLAPSHAPEGAEHDDEAGLLDADDNGNGKSTVRDIITWKEAIGMIIDGNMQSRAESPQSQHHSRPSRGRGRGRGGRGGRGGGHRH